MKCFKILLLLSAILVCFCIFNPNDDADIVLDNGSYQSVIDKHGNPATVIAFDYRAKGASCCVGGYGLKYGNHSGAVYWYMLKTLETGKTFTICDTLNLTIPANHNV